MPGDTAETKMSSGGEFAIRLGEMVSLNPVK